MKNSEIKQEFQNVVELINYCSNNKIKCMALNMGLLSNFDLLKSTTENIDKCISQELKDLEQKMMDLAKEAKEKLTDEEKSKLVNDFDYGYSLLTEEEKSKHKELMIEYNKQMDEDIEFELLKFKLSESQLDSIEMDVAHVVVLRKYLK